MNADPLPIERYLIHRLRGAWLKRFAPHRKPVTRHVPARIDLLGGLAAEVGGAAAQMTLPHRLGLAIQPRDDAKLVVHSDNIEPPVGDPDFVLPLESLYRNGALLPAKEIAARIAPQSAWATPVVALCYLLLQQFRDSARVSPARPAGGATVAVYSQIPLSAAQASSTALVVAALQAACEIYRIRLDPLETALLAQRAENLFSPAGAHAIDAMTALQALPGHVLRYTCRPHTLVGQIPLPAELRVVALDTGVRVATAAETVHSVRLAGAIGLRIVENIYKDLGRQSTPLRGYLTNLSPMLYRRYFHNLLPRRMRGADFLRTYGEPPERVGPLDPEQLYRVRTAVDHLITEHEHAENFLQALEELADPANPAPEAERELTRRRAGRLLLASHHSYRLRLELSSRESDLLVETLMRHGPDRGIYGARISGHGGGGTVVALLNRSASAGDALLDAASAYDRMTGLHLTLTEAGTAGSAGALVK